MAKTKALGISAALLVSSLGHTAWADVTPSDVWANWQELGASLGQTLSAGSETLSGGTLTITDLQTAVPMVDGTVQGNIDEVVFTDQGDGTVAISFSPEYTLTVNATPPDEEPFSMAMRLVHTGMSIVASGAPDAINYDFSADQMDMVIDALDAGGDEVDVDATLAMQQLTGAYNTTSGDPASVTSALQVASVALNLTASEPDGGSGSLNMSMTIDGLAGQSEGTIPSAMILSDMPAAIRAGMESRGGYTHGPASFGMDFSDASEQFAMNAEASSGAVDVDLSQNGLSYSVGSTGVQATFSGSEIPFPQVNFAAEQSLTRFAMPVMPKDTADPFAVVVKLIGATVGEEIWSMFDPTGGLPRDPATLVVDLSGAARLTTDIFAAEPEPLLGPPGEMENLSINELRLSIAGGELTGSGAFTVDNTQPGMAPGVPAAEGAVDLKLVGANGLLDKLVQLGLLPQEQAMGARMMMGMVARPGEGEDTLVSRIEIGADGSISANGQRLK